jgi:excisionase family DNA binding protein
MQGVLTTSQAAKELKISKSRVIALISAGRLPAERVGMQFLIAKKDLAKVRVRKPGRPSGKASSKG